MLDSRQESRHAERVHLEKVVCIRLQHSNHAIVVNLSDQGLAFHSVFPIMESGTIPFSFVKPDGERAEITARLAWTDDSKRNGGLQFDLTRPSTQADILVWVARSLVAEHVELPPRPTVGPVAPQMESPFAGAQPTPETERSGLEQPVPSEAPPVAPPVPLDERPSQDFFGLRPNPLLEMPLPAPRMPLPEPIAPWPVVSSQDQETLHSQTLSHRAKLASPRKEPKRQESSPHNLQWVAAALILVSIFFVGLFELRSRLSVRASAPQLESPAKSSMGLRLEHVGKDWRLSWNPDAPAISNAVSGQLSITDGTFHRVLDLDPSDLQSGTMMYTPVTNDVILRLEVQTPTSQTPIRESIRIASSGPSSLASDGADSSVGNARVNVGSSGVPAIAQARPTKDSAAGSEVSTPPDHRLPIGPLQLLPGIQIQNKPAQSSQATEAGIPALGIQPSSQLGSTSNLDAMPPQPPEPPASAAPKPEAAPPAAARVEPAQLLERKEPVYPALGRDVRLSGSVEVHFHIRTDGTVDHVSVVSGNAILAKAAVDAVQTWRYKPAMMNGIPVETESNAVLSFNR